MTPLSFHPARRLLRVLLGTLILLCIPLVAMQFTGEVDWRPGDFVVAGTLLTAAGVVYELGVRPIGHVALRRLLAVGLGLALVWVWLELAVGVFTTWGS